MKRRILIADADEKFRTELTKALEAYEEFEVVGIATDGEETIQMLKKQWVDIVVLDLLLPKYDSFTILEMIPNMCNHPQILVTSAFISNYVAASAVRMGVQQLIYKPCDVGVVIRNLYRMVDDKNYGPAIFLWNGEKNIETLVTRILHYIGVPANIKGYQYLREAIVLASKDEDSHNAILKSRYREVAATFGTSATKVERAIRGAIEIAWDRGDLDILQHYFGYTVSNTKGKPTNTEFISIVADQIRLWLNENVDELK